MLNRLSRPSLPIVPLKAPIDLIGSPYVIDGMKGLDQVVGYEANGGTLTGSEFTLPSGDTLSALPTRDAMLPAIATFALAKQHNMPLSQLSSLLPARFTCSDRLVG